MQARVYISLIRSTSAEVWRFVFHHMTAWRQNKWCQQRWPNKIYGQQLGIGFLGDFSVLLELGIWNSTPMMKTNSAQTQTVELIKKLTLCRVHYSSISPYILPPRSFFRPPAGGLPLLWFTASLVTFCSSFINHSPQIYSPFKDDVYPIHGIFLNLRIT